jgi:4-amino-4-deoxy-L-arabinose transferase-like glycosyltransferase
MVKKLFQRLDRSAEKWAADPQFLLKLFCLALFLRLGLVLLHRQVTLISDMLGYHEAAVSLLQDGVFSVKGRLSASRPPVYSIFIYLIYYIFGVGNVFIVRIIQSVIGALTALLTFKLAEKVFNRRVAVWSGLFFTLYPVAWGYCDLVLSETLFTFLLVASMIFLVDMPKGKLSDAFIAGLLLGVTTLTRTVLYQFPFFIAIYYLIFSKNRLRLIPSLAVLVVASWIVLLPWMARNQRVFGESTLSTKSGVDFYLYNHSPFKYILYNYSQEGEDALGGITPWKLSEVERNQICQKAALDWIKSHPLLWAFKGVRMEWNFFSVEREYVWSLMAGYWGPIPRWMLALGLLITAPTIYLLMPLFIWGIVYGYDKSEHQKNLLLLLFYFLAITFVFYGFSRHRTPLNPIMMIYAGVALTAYAPILADLKRGIFWSRPRAVIATGILVFFIIGWALEIFIDVGSLLHLGFTFEGWNPVNAGS